MTAASNGRLRAGRPCRRGQGVGKAADRNTNILASLFPSLILDRIYSQFHVLSCFRFTPLVDLSTSGPWTLAFLMHAPLARKSGVFHRILSLSFLHTRTCLQALALSVFVLGAGCRPKCITSCVRSKVPPVHCATGCTCSLLPLRACRCPSPPLPHPPAAPARVPSLSCSKFAVGPTDFKMVRSCKMNWPLSVLAAQGTPCNLNLQLHA